MFCIIEVIYRSIVDDFFQSIADGSGNPDVVDAMKSFVDQPGLPLVKVKMICEAGESFSKVEVSQSRYAPLGSKISPFIQLRLEELVQ